jgi:predicted nucleic acid-binding protein
METLVIDASIAVKWIIEEDGSGHAVGLRYRYRFAAPDLLMAESSNVLWKKAQRGELTPAEAIMAARLLARADIELFSTRNLLETATSLAIDLGHPVYDCIYLALAQKSQWRFVTADKSYLRIVSEKKPEHAELCVSLDQLHPKL